MSEKGREKKNMKVCLLGASFVTGNMGVSALAESSIKIILHRWPNAEVILFGSGYKPEEYNLSLSDKEICLKNVPVRFSKNIFMQYHFLCFTFYGFLIKILPGSSLKKALANRNPYFKTLYEMDFAVDITGGDSFSDIYGMRRFVLMSLCKWLVILMGKKLVFLPQTYGPFKRKTAKFIAKYILKRVDMVYSRDQDSLEYVKNLLNYRTVNGKVRFAPDVAFVLDSREPSNIGVDSLLIARKDNSVMVGLNVSGLLYSGGYNYNNMFGLKTDYPELVYSIAESLLENENVTIMLVPHVLPPEGFEIDDDFDACCKLYEKLNQKYQNRIFLVRGQYNQNEIKYIIGLCEFFIGSRMHSCIAALSQCIPAVGVAYSKKFYGVFKSVGLDNCVADARSLHQDQILEIIRSAFNQREKSRRLLEKKIPQIKEDVFNICLTNN